MNGVCVCVEMQNSQFTPLRKKKKKKKKQKQNDDTETKWAKRGLTHFTNGPFVPSARTPSVAMWGRAATGAGPGFGWESSRSSKGGGSWMKVVPADD